MRSAWEWAKAQYRGRLIRLCALGLMLGLVSAVALTAIAGARRTASVYARHAASVSQPDMWISTSLDPELWRPGVLEPFFNIQGVAAHTELATFTMRPAGTDFFGLFDHSVAGAVDDTFGATRNRLRIVDGRMYERSAADEVVVTEEYAEQAGLAVGDVVTFESWTSEAITLGFATNYDLGEPDGPEIELTVVGISREVNELPTNAGSSGSAYVSEAFTRRWRGRVGNALPIGLIYLANGPSGVDAFRASATSLGEGAQSPVLVQELSAMTAEVASAIDTQVIALWAFALVTIAAGVAVLIAALARQLAFAADGHETLRAIGMLEWDRIGATAMVAVPTALIGGAVAVGLAVVGSTLLPIGTPGRIEPTPGVRTDLPVLAVGGMTVIAAVLAAALAIGRSIVRRARSGQPQPTNPTLGASIARWLSGSAPASLGMRQALDTGRGEWSPLARSTLAVCTLGILGIVATAVFTMSLGHLRATPRLYGVAGDFYVSAFGGEAEWEALATDLESDPSIDSLATFIATDVVVNGQSVGALVTDPRRGDPISSVVAGRAPQARDEMTLGRALASRLGVGIGDTVTVQLAGGSDTPYSVVGLNALPDPMEGYSDQAALLGTSLARFATTDPGPWYGVAVGFADGVDVEATEAALLARDDVGSGFSLAEPVPKAVASLVEATVFARALMAVLAILTGVFMLSALLTTTRRRTHEAAVLKALGFQRRQLQLLVVVQAITIAVVSVAVGIPLGMGAGRIAWTTTASDLGLVPETALAAWPLLWPIVTILAAWIVGWIASRSLVRVRPDVELRAGRFSG